MVSFSLGSCHLKRFHGTRESCTSPPSIDTSTSHHPLSPCLRHFFIRININNLKSSNISHQLSCRTIQTVSGMKQEWIPLTQVTVAIVDGCRCQNSHSYLNRKKYRLIRAFCFAVAEIYRLYMRATKILVFSLGIFVSSASSCTRGTFSLVHGGRGPWWSPWFSWILSTTTMLNLVQMNSPISWSFGTDDFSWPIICISSWYKVNWIGTIYYPRKW